MSFFPHSSIQLSELLCTSRSNFFRRLTVSLCGCPNTALRTNLVGQHQKTKHLLHRLQVLRQATIHRPPISYRNIPGSSCSPWKRLPAAPSFPFSSTESLAAVCWRVLCRTLLPSLDASTIVVSRRGRFWEITSLCAGSWRGRMRKSHASLVLSGNSQFLGCFQKQRCKWANNCSHSLDDVNTLTTPGRTCGVCIFLGEKLALAASGWTVGRQGVGIGTTRAPPTCWSSGVKCGVQKASRCWALPKGTPKFVEDVTQRRLEEENRLWEAISSVPDLQCAWQILLQCAGPRCHHLLRTLLPSVSPSYANRAQCGHAEDDGGLVRRIARRPNPERSGPHALEFAPCGWAVWV